jgi:hypothetical protein
LDRQKGTVKGGIDKRGRAKGEKREGLRVRKGEGLRVVGKGERVVGKRGKGGGKRGKG